MQQTYVPTTLSIADQQQWVEGLEITEHDLPPELMQTLFCSEFTDSQR
jgi:hypothetical protein